MTAEYGDAYLPIDDDAPDRGNDGYLKPERRVFAAHCFKRVQNQRLLSGIRSKMLGDLGKAIALKTYGAWEIEAWTFLSNYPIPEAIAAEVVRVGAENNIDVSWRGPDALATALQRHAAVRAQFPSLQVNEIGEHLSQLARAVDTLKGDDRSPDGIPRTAAQRAALVRDKPAAWEYLLFTGILLAGRDDLALKWRDHELRLPRGPRVELGLEEAVAYLGEQFRAVTDRVDSMMRVFAVDAQEAAFGPPGVSGDAVKVEHIARRILLGYEELLDWAAAIRAVVAPAALAPAFETAARMVDLPLLQFRRFIDDAEREMQRAVRHLADPNPDRGQLQINLELVLAVDPAVSKEFAKRTKRARRLIRWGV